MKKYLVKKLLSKKQLKKLLKHLKKLQKKKQRDQQGLFVAEGAKIALDLLRGGLTLDFVCGLAETLPPLTNIMFSPHSTPLASTRGLCPLLVCRGFCYLEIRPILW